MLSKSFKAGKCKTSLKLAMARIKLLKNKRDVQVKQMKRDLAHLLETGQDQTARIRVEHVIREEKTVSAYDLIELYCEMIVARLPIIESQKNCPIDLKEAITSVVFASPRCADIPELLDVRKHFTAKYGKDFINSALELRPECGVNRMIVEKLSARAPEIDTKIKILKAVAQEHNIEWDSHAFEEKLQKPREDVLTVPSNSASTSKMPMESSHVQFPSPPAHKHESATKLSETDVASLSVSSTSFSSPNIDTSSTLRHTTSRPEHEVSESRNEGGKFGHSLPKGEDPLSNRQSWNMEFKDATSAAQAAAESAERASMAARAAVDLASRGNYTRQSSGSHDSGRDGGPREPMSSNTEDTVKPRRRKPIIQNQQSDGSMQDSLRRAPERINEGYGSVESSSTMSIPSPSRGPLVDDDISNVIPRKPNSCSQVSSSDRHSVNQNWGGEEIRKDNTLGESSAKENFVQYGSSLHSKKSIDGNVFIEDLQRADSYAQKSFSEAEENWNGKKIEIADVGHGSIERKPSEFASSSFCDETMSDSHDQKQETYVFGPGKGVSQSGSNQQSYPNVSSAVFDESGSDDDDHLEISSFMKEQKPDSYLPHQGTISPHSLNRGPWDPQQHESTFLENDGTTMLSESHPAEFNESLLKDALPSHSAGISYDTYDSSDSSEIEEEKDKFTHREAEPGVNDGSNRSYGRVDLHQEQQSSRNSKSFMNANDIERHSVDKEQLPPQSSNISPKKEEENMDKYGLPPSPSRTKDSEGPFNLNYEGSQDLNVGRLTGGLRNKGFRLPPYQRSHLDVTSKQIEDDCPPPIEKSTSSQAAMATASFEVPQPGAYNQNPHVKSYKESKSRTPGTDLDTDSTETKEVQSHHGRGGRGYKLQAEHLVNSNDRQAVFPSRKTSESGELHTQEPFNQRLRTNASKESSPNTYLDLSGDKHGLNAVESRGRGRVEAPLSSDKRADVTSRKASSSSENSNLDVYKQKPRVKNLRESEVRTKISYFDSDSDEGEDLQPQHTGGGRDNRASKLSQRRVLPSESKAGRLSWSTGQSSVSDASAQGSRPSQLRSSVSEPLSESIAQTPDLKKKEDPKFLQTKLSAEQPSTPRSQTGGLVDKGRVNSSSENPPSNGKPKSSISSGRSTSRESSLESAAHVHPKLPDYETLAAHFHSLRSNRGGPV